jgi:hypothetical protein
VCSGANMKDKTYRLLEMIVPNYLSLMRVEDMIDKKHKKGDFYIKSIPELINLYDVVTNVFNSLEDPENVLKTVSADTTRNFSKKLYDIANNVTTD